MKQGWNFSPVAPVNRTEFNPRVENATYSQPLTTVLQGKTRLHIAILYYQGHYSRNAVSLRNPVKLPIDRGVTPAWRNTQLVAMFFITDFNNVAMPISFIVVNSIVHYCWAWISQQSGSTILGKFRFDYGYENEYDYEIFIS